jgi:hypothetical protein
MGKFNNLLNLRLKSKEAPKQKMSALVARANTGNLSSFSGIFKIKPPTKKEQKAISDILNTYKSSQTTDIDKDLLDLSKISSEVKAITNQAVMLHGERIKQAQTILKNYQDGAFTAWLLATYGNRQTPYNFLQYYEFYTSMPDDLHKKIDEMPRQAIYTLASRSGEKEHKKEVVINYKGEPKRELLSIIRELFPLSDSDKRLPNLGIQSIAFLKRLSKLVKQKRFSPSDAQKKQIKQLMQTIQEGLDF